jgi:hypothetical protein
MYGGYVGGEIIYASIPRVIGGPGEDNEIFISSAGPAENADGSSSSQQGSGSQII